VEVCNNSRTYLVFLTLLGSPSALT